MIDITVRLRFCIVVGVIITSLHGLSLSPIQSNPSLPSHPRLILTSDRLQQLQTYIENDETAQNLYQQLLIHCDWVLTQPPTVRPPPGPSGILIAVRQAMDYMLTTALAYKLNNNITYYNRAILEALNFANWSDYNPWAHTLDTGEASMALGLVIDWLYNDLNSTSKSTLVNALFTKGLTPFYLGYQNKSFFWVNNTINWNCVCSGGSIVGTLAIADEPNMPSWVWSGVYDISLTSMPVCISAYSSEGSWEEGQGYWEYASKFNVLTFTALYTAQLPEDEAKLITIPGVNITGSFPAFMTGTSGTMYDWADSEPDFVVAYGDSFLSTAPNIQYWGLRFNDTAASYFSTQLSLINGPTALNMPQWATQAEALIYYVGPGTFNALSNYPSSKVYYQRELGIYRSQWTNPAIATNNTHSLHFKGGNNNWNHNHLDLSSFIYDWYGNRLIMDLGADNYNLPNYFDPTVRWTYYRLNSQGHNVLKFNNESQSTSAEASIIHFNSTDTYSPSTGYQTQQGWAIVDNHEAYSKQGIVNTTRGFVFMNNGSTIIVADSFSVQNNTIMNISWSVHINGTITIDPTGQLGTVYLSNTLTPTQPAYLWILPSSMGTQCNGLKITATNVSLPEPQYSMSGIIRVDIVTTSPSECSLIAIALGDNIQSMEKGIRLRSVLEWKDVNSPWY